jgi:molybdopterin converting factor small subunit
MAAWHNPDATNDHGGHVPAITVGLPAALTSPQPARDVHCEASTVDEALRAVVEQAPQFEQRIFYGDRLLVVLTLNGKHLPPATARETELAAGDRVDILLPVAGG